MPVTSDEVTKALQTLQSLAEGHRTVFGLPIPWVAESIFAGGFQIAPQFAVPPALPGSNQVITTTYLVPRGYTALICGLVFGYAGGAGAALPGQVIYTVDANNPNAALVSPAPGYVIKDYNQVPFQLGALVGGPVWPVEFRFDQNEEVRIKAYTVSGVAVGAGNFVFGALVGFQWPTMGWEG